MSKISGLLGYLLVGAFIYICVTKFTSNPELFVNSHGLIIVIGGLFVAAVASFPMALLFQSVGALVKSMGPRGRVSTQVAEEIVAVAKAQQKGMAELDKISAGIRDPFLKQAVNLILEGIQLQTIQEILNKRIEERSAATNTQMNVYLTLSKYSPALGLAATVLGLVDLLGQLASADLAKLGYGMAIALSATFYGIVLSNLVFAPLSEMIMASGEIEVREMEMVRDGIQALIEKKNSLVVGEIVNSYIEENRRIDFTKVTKINNAA